MREKREEKREKEGKKREGRRKRVGQGMRCDFSPHSSFPSDLQVISREKSQGKSRNK